MALSGVTPPDLPAFTNFIIIGAGELNRISANQLYLDGIHQTLNWPFEFTFDGYVRYPFHRHRYLYWQTRDSSSAQMVINGISAGQVAAAATSGFVDLGNGYDIWVSNPYNLTLHRPYGVEWIDGSVTCRLLAEHQESNGILTLPYPSDTFFSGQTPTANHFNNIAGNTGYLIQNAGMQASGGFTARSYDIYPPDREIRWLIWRRHRFLHFRARYDSVGGGTNWVRLRINGRRCFQQHVPPSTTGLYDCVVDLDNGGQNVNYGPNGAFDFSDGPLDAPVGQFYDVTLFVEDDGGTPSRLYTYLLCEGPSNARI